MSDDLLREFVKTVILESTAPSEEELQNALATIQSRLSGKGAALLLPKIKSIIKPGTYEQEMNEFVQALEIYKKAYESAVEVYEKEFFEALKELMNTDEFQKCARFVKSQSVPAYAYDLLRATFLQMQGKRTPGPRGRKAIEKFMTIAKRFAVPNSSASAYENRISSEVFPQGSGSTLTIDSSNVFQTLAKIDLLLRSEFGLNDFRSAAKKALNETSFMMKNARLKYSAINDDYFKNTLSDVPYNQEKIEKMEFQKRVDQEISRREQEKMERDKAAMRNDEPRWMHRDLR